MLSYNDEHRVAGLNGVGLMQRSERDSDQHVFKVPTLHAIAETAAYYHNGNIEMLELATEVMAQYQLGRVPAQQDIDDIAAFLRSLGGRPTAMAMGNARVCCYRDISRLSPACLPYCASNH
jgi:cytochrome c peroxidase